MFAMADTKPEITGSAKDELKDMLFGNILNFRDVGKTINEFLGEKYDISLMSSPVSAICIEVRALVQEKAYYTFLS